MSEMIGGGRPQVNKFEQVSSLGHQMLLAVGAGTLYRGAEVGMNRGGGALSIGTPSSGQSDMTKNITFPQLRWWAVITKPLSQTFIQTDLILVNKATV